MKVIKTNQSDQKLTSEIDLFEDLPLPRSEKRKVAREVGEFLQDSILTSVGNSRSPLAGGRWPGLSKSYKKFKEDNNRPGVPNIEFTGKTLDQLKFSVSGDGKLEIGVFGNRADIADGHNNFSGDSDLPLRRFLPKEDDRFKRSIQSEVDRIISESVASRVKIDKALFSKIETKRTFFEELNRLFVGLTRSQIITAVLQDGELVSTFKSLNLLRFLNG